MMSSFSTHSAISYEYSDSYEIAVYLALLAFGYVTRRLASPNECDRRFNLSLLL